MIQLMPFLGFGNLSPLLTPHSSTPQALLTILIPNHTSTYPLLTTVELYVTHWPWRWTRLRDRNPSQRGASAATESLTVCERIQPALGATGRTGVSLGLEIRTGIPARGVA